MFKIMTNFTVLGFEELYNLVYPLILINARFICELQLLREHPLKLSPKQRLLNFIWYMKNDDVTTYDSYY
jgi:hypothetical protein